MSACGELPLLTVCKRLKTSARLTEHVSNRSQTFAHVCDFERTSGTYCLDVRGAGPVSNIRYILSGGDAIAGGAGVEVLSRELQQGGVSAHVVHHHARVDGRRTDVGVLTSRGERRGGSTRGRGTQRGGIQTDRWTDT